MLGKNKISAAIIAFNEEKNIADCLRNLEDICDEVVVVDSLSKDRTVEIAREMGARVTQHKYLGDGPQKQLATNLTTHDWVLSIDADERLDDDAKESISSLSFKDTQTAYSFKRKNYVGKRWVNASDFYPDRKTRLFNKLHSRYSDKKGHSYVMSEKVVPLEGNIIHLAYEDYAHWIKKYNFLSSRDAWVKKDKAISNMQILLHSSWTFFKKYILKGGFTKGMDGLTVSLFAAFFNYVKYIKVKEIRKKRRQDQQHFDPGVLR